VIFIRELTDQRIKSASDLSILPGAQLLGVIPDLEEDPTKCETAELVIKRHPNSVLAESYRQVCTPLSKGLDRAGHQTLVFVGGLPGTGTTTVATNVATGLAAAGRNVVVVDANFRRPRLGGTFALDNDRVGLGDLIQGDGATVEQAITEDAETGVKVITAGTAATRVVDRLNTERFDSVVAELRGRFDVIIFDAPPAVVAGDALMLANRVDAAVLVVRANQEQRGLVARLMNQLGNAHCDLLGLVLNRPLGTAGGYFKKNYAAMAAYAASDDAKS
jgi:capsular exopolysaccharide synthesis family protein